MLRDVPGDRLALTVEVGGKPDMVGLARKFGEAVQLLSAVGQRDILDGEVALDVDAEAPLRKVTHVAERGDDLVSGSEIAFDGAGLGRRLDDDELAGGPSGGRGRHSVRECSTGFRCFHYRSITAEIEGTAPGGGPFAAVIGRRRQPTKSQVMITVAPAWAMPTPIRVKLGLRMLPMWFHWPG